MYWQPWRGVGNREPQAGSGVPPTIRPLRSFDRSKVLAETYLGKELAWTQRVLRASKESFARGEALEFRLGKYGNLSVTQDSRITVTQKGRSSTVGFADFPRLASVVQKRSGNVSTPNLHLELPGPDVRSLDVPLHEIGNLAALEFLLGLKPF